jgi:hypothetical protein
MQIAHAGSTLPTAASLKDQWAALDKIAKWTETNDLQGNKEKTEIMVFRNGVRVAKKITWRSWKTELKWHNLTIRLLRTWVPHSESKSIRGK